jgi:hypothetical protein
MKTLYYFQFWLRTSGQSNHASVRAFQIRPSKDELKDMVENWCKTHSCTEIAEHYSYGWRQIKKLPKNRSECLKWHDKSCKVLNKAKERQRLIAGLLGVKPFNGLK